MSYLKILVQILCEISKHFDKAHYVPGTIFSTLYAYFLCDMKCVKDRVKARFWRKDKLREQ